MKEIVLTKGKQRGYMNEFEKGNYKILPISREACIPWIMKKHYAKRMPSITYAFGLYINLCLNGICTFGQPPNQNISLCCGGKYQNNTIELNRLIKNDNLLKNTQTWFVTKCFSLLPKPLIIISYSDPNYNHFGYTYQALNFLYTGMGGESKEYYFNNRRYNSRHIKDYWFHARKILFDYSRTVDSNFENAGGIIKRVNQKHRYIYFLGNKLQKKEMKKLLAWDIYPYPKGQNINYDTSFNPLVQKRMF